MAKPKYRVVAKSKSSGKYQDVVAMWENERGVSGTLDRDVEKIVLKNGQVLTNASCYFNLQIADNEHDQRVAASENQSQVDPSVDDEVPF